MRPPSQRATTSAPCRRRPRPPARRHGGCRHRRQRGQRYRCKRPAHRCRKSAALKVEPRAHRSANRAATALRSTRANTDRSAGLHLPGGQSGLAQSRAFTLILSRSDGQYRRTAYTRSTHARCCRGIEQVSQAVVAAQRLQQHFVPERCAVLAIVRLWRQPASVNRLSQLGTTFLFPVTCQPTQVLAQQLLAQGNPVMRSKAALA